MKWSFAAKKNWGMFLLAVWLIMTGLQPFVNLTFLHLSLISALLAIAAGVLILLGR
jgi:hypothetical protein